MRIAFSVVGLPAPKGSSRAMIRGGHAVNVPSGSDVARVKLRGWNAEVMAASAGAMAGKPPIAEQALRVDLRFRFPRTKAHFGKKGIKPTAPSRHALKPDLDKIVRATWDAMAGIVFDDDSRIAVVAAEKNYCALGEVPGADITVTTVEGT